MEAGAALRRFVDSSVDRATLGLVYGRRRIGKTTALVDLVDDRGGFYFEATRVDGAMQLSRLGRSLGRHLGVGPLALRDWEDAIERLVALGEGGPVPVVLDEFGHLLAAEPSLDSVISTVLGPAARRTRDSRARLILCGSAISIMRALTAGQSPLRGRAGLELLMHPDDYRTAAGRLPATISLRAAARVYAAIGGVVGYATDMVDFDLPTSDDDVDRWIVERILSPAATLHHEATTLLAEDPGLRTAPTTHHSVLAAIASGSTTAGGIANRLGRSASNLAPALNRLVDAGFVSRLEDPLRARRPRYELTDPYLRFHHAIIEPRAGLLRRGGLATTWAEQLQPVFDAQVRGPVFEQQVRTWIERFADLDLGDTAFLGPAIITDQGATHEVDVVAAGPGDTPAERAVHLLGEAKAGERLTTRHLDRLEQIRTSLGGRASGATLLLSGAAATEHLLQTASVREDVVVADLPRLYGRDPR